MSQINGKIAVICAYNPRNCGMYSVDMAAHQFLTSLGCEFTFFVAQQKSEFKDWSYGKLHFRRLIDLQQLDEYSLILYWGDFINNPVYGNEDFADREVSWGALSSHHEGYEKWKKIFLLIGCARRQKVISVSNNFQNILAYFKSSGIADRDAVIGAYKENFDWILPRDGLSFMNMSVLLPELKERMALGIDVAFLLDPLLAYPALADIRQSNTFVYYFHRSNLSNVNWLLFRIWVKTGCRPVCAKDWLRMNKSNPDETYFRNISKIKSAKFVVSDTYHCLINAMNLEKPVIGIGKKASSQEGTCGDLKKYILFDDFGLGDFYIETDERQDRLLELILSKINNICAFQNENILRRKLQYRELLTNLILDGVS